MKIKGKAYRTIWFDEKNQTVKIIDQTKLPHQFIDRTFARKKTFFDEDIVAHVSMAHPTSNGLMNACEEAIKKEKINYQMGGT